MIEGFGQYLLQNSDRMPMRACWECFARHEHCVALDKAADLPIVLYNSPGRTGADMGSDWPRLLAVAV